jgi:HNH endonuclease
VVDVFGGYVLVDCSFVPLYSRVTSSANTGVTLAATEERGGSTEYAVETVDHYLPKKHFVQFAIAFENLVPACRDCNTEKRDQAPKAQSELFSHPYYESCYPHRWLSAIIESRSPLSFQFSVKRDDPRSVENRRFENQFESLQLPRRYATDAVGEYYTSQFSLQQVYDQAGKDGLIENLLRTALSAEQSPYMPWKAAMYRALATDDWFTSGGFI